MYSCKEAVRLTNESFHRTLSVREKMGMRLHMLMCKACRQVSRQLVFIRKITHTWLQTTDKGLNATLPDSSKARIRKAMEKAQDHKNQ